MQIENAHINRWMGMHFMVVGQNQTGEAVDSSQDDPQHS